MLKISAQNFDCFRNVVHTDPTYRGIHTVSGFSLNYEKFPHPYIFPLKLFLHVLPLMLFFFLFDLAELKSLSETMIKNQIKNPSINFI